MHKKASCGDIEGLFIESWSGSTVYLAEMLTEGAQSWWVEAKYPVLSDHEKIA